VTRTPLSRSKGQRSRSPGHFAHRHVGATDGCSGGRGNVLAVGNCCYVALCSAVEGASAPTGGGGEGRGHTVAAVGYSLFFRRSLGIRLGPVKICQRRFGNVFFHRPDALSVTQPAVSKHRRPATASYMTVRYIAQGTSLQSLCWHHEGKQFVSALSDGSLNFWNVKTPQKPTSCVIPHCEYSAHH